MTFATDFKLINLLHTENANLTYEDVMGVLNPNDQYNIYWTMYDRLSNDLCLSSSYPKTQPLAP